jgi:hypothetical protein
MSEKYRIDCFDDFLKVPPERVGDCLAEICEAIELGCNLKTIQDAIAPDKPFHFTGFEWTDDGKKDSKIKLTTPTP